MNPKRFARLCKLRWLAQAVTSALLPAMAVGADDAKHEMAQELKNPVSSLTLVPLQSNFEFGSGPNHPLRYTLNVQPVIPFALNSDWRVITRLVLPVVYQESPFSGEQVARLRRLGERSEELATHTSGRLRERLLNFGNGAKVIADKIDDDVFGLSDTQLSFFLSPAKKPNGFVWGVGPVVELPTATNTLLGPQKWGAGPTAVFLKQTGGWTAGLLLNHLWSFAGPGETDVSNTFIDAWVSYTWPNSFAINLESESSYDWEASQATIPIRAGFSQLVNVGKQPVQFNLDGLYYFERAEFAPQWGVSFTITFVFQ